MLTSGRVVFTDMEEVHYGKPAIRECSSVKVRSKRIVNFITGMIGIAGICAFLGILLWWIKAVPLIIIAVVVVALLIWDFYKSLRADDNRTR